MSNFTDHSPDDSPDRAAMLERLAEASSAPAELARELGVSLIELAAIAMQPDAKRSLEQVIDLATIHRRLLLARLKLNAVAHLATMAAGLEGSETARKACVDLLRADVIGAPGSRVRADQSPRPPSPNPLDDPPPPANVYHAILDELGRIGAETNPERTGRALRESGSEGRREEAARQGAADSARATPSSSGSGSDHHRPLTGLEAESRMWCGPARCRSPSGCERTRAAPEGRATSPARRP